MSMEMIAVAIGIKGRQAIFREVVAALARQSAARSINLLLLDGSETEVFRPGSEVEAFASIRMWRESEVIHPDLRGRWPALYNFLLNQTTDPYLCYWSDVTPDHPRCFQSAATLLAQKPKLGAVCYPWRNGSGARLHIYRTERFDQPLLNFGLVRREAFRDVGGLDERYHFYYADQDFSLRLWKKGWEVDATERDGLAVTHLLGEKSDNLYRQPEWTAMDRSTFHDTWG